MPSRSLPEERVFQIANAGNDICQTITLYGIDQLLLNCARWAFMQAAEGQASISKEVLRAARAVAPRSDAADILKNMQKLVHHLGGARTTQFNFVPPNDVHARMFLLPEEKTLMLLFYHLRQAEKSRARTQLVMLCERGEGAEVMAAARALSEHVQMSWSERRKVA